MTSKEECRQWAIEVLCEPSAIILETQTTGLSRDAQVIQICIIDTSGKVLFDSYIQPTIAVTPEAFRVHCISMDILQFAPRFDSIRSELEYITSRSIVLSYNHYFEERVMSVPCRSRGNQLNGNTKPIGRVIALIYLPTRWGNQLNGNTCLLQQLALKNQRS